MMFGRSTVFWPRNRSTLTALSRLKRAGDCARAGAAQMSASSRTARQTLGRRLSTDHLGADLGTDLGVERAKVRCHARQGRREGADDLGMELGACAAPQLAHGGPWGHGA